MNAVDLKCVRICDHIELFAIATPMECVSKHRLLRPHWADDVVLAGHYVAVDRLLKYPIQIGVSPHFLNAKTLQQYFRIVGRFAREH